MSLHRVAIHGSCVSRDNFNTQFNADYKDRYTVTLLQNQSSIVSSAAPPLSGIEDQISGLNDWSRTTVLNDCSKNFLSRYHDSKEGIVIFDNFADVRFGYSEILNTRVTHNVWQIGNSRFEQNFKGIKDHKPTDNIRAYLPVYRKSLKHVIKIIRRANPEAIIILNCARAASDEVSEAGLTKGKYRMSRFNEAWAALDKAFMEIVPECCPITVSHDRIIGWAGHPWGPGYVHYVPEFYNEFLEKLGTTLDDAAGARRSTPTVGMPGSPRELIKRLYAACFPNRHKDPAGTND
jgi:hypothetical protein